jgi:hypothetical protein
VLQGQSPSQLSPEPQKIDDLGPDGRCQAVPVCDQLLECRTLPAHWTKRLRREMGERPQCPTRAEGSSSRGEFLSDTFLDCAAIGAGLTSYARKGIAMSRVRKRMIQDMRLAGLVEGSQQQYLRAVRQLAAYYMVSPDQLSERHVEKYILYVRDELGVARGTFVPMFFGLKFFYVNTLGYDWPLFTKKKSASRTGGGCPTSAATRIAAA